jgi:TetR/AcrR family transcriptional regulator, tetracycline repressor protein
MARASSDHPGPSKNGPVSARRRSAGTRLPRGSLSRESIIDTAYDFLKTNELAALTMPEIARRLEATTMGLYRYFRGKDELLDAIETKAMIEMYASEHTEGTSEERLRAHFRNVRQFALDHLGVAELLYLRGRMGGVSPNLPRDVVTVEAEAHLSGLVERGMAPPVAARFFAMLGIFTMGFSVWENSRRHEPPIFEIRWNQEIASIPGSTFPVLLAASSNLANVASDQQFEFGLKLMLSSIDSIVKDQDAWSDENLLIALNAPPKGRSRQKHK